MFFCLILIEFVLAIVVTADAIMVLLKVTKFVLVKLSFNMPSQVPILTVPSNDKGFTFSHLILEQ